MEPPGELSPGGFFVYSYTKFFRILLSKNLENVS